MKNDVLFKTITVFDGTETYPDINGLDEEVQAIFNRSSDMCVNCIFVTLDSKLDRVRYPILTSVMEEQNIESCCVEF